jgi:hypothetical protein
MAPLLRRTGSLQPRTRALPAASRSLSSTTSRLSPQTSKKDRPLLETDLSFIRHNPTEPKPRTKGLTEIRVAYYTVMGPNYLHDVLETMGHWVDGLKFAGGSHTLFPEHKLREVINLAHDHGVYVSTGGISLTSTLIRFHRTPVNSSESCCND